jgi:hypothetical protein
MAFKHFVLDDGDQVEWNDADGWKVLDANGSIKGVGATGPAGPAGDLTVEEVDGAPSVASVTKIKFAEADGFTVTDEGGGIARINVAGSGAGLSSVDLEFLAWVL